MILAIVKVLPEPDAEQNLMLLAFIDTAREIGNGRLLVALRTVGNRQLEGHNLQYRKRLFAEPETIPPTVTTVLVLMGFPKMCQKGYDLTMEDSDSNESFAGWPVDLSSGHPPLS